MDPVVGSALVGALSLLASLLLTRWLGRADRLAEERRVDAARDDARDAAFRTEQRADLVACRDDLAACHADRDNWRERYFTLREQCGVRLDKGQGQGA